MGFLGFRTVDETVKAILAELSVEHQRAIMEKDAQTAKVIEVVHRVIKKVFFT